MAVLDLVPSSVIWVLAIVFLLTVIVALSGGNSRSKSYEFKRGNNLLSVSERQFFNVLNSAMGQTYSIFIKVRVADIVTPRMARASKNWIRAFNQISAKHFDFVLCSPDSFAVVAVVELDDSSHRARLASKRDEIKNHVCQSAGIPLIRFKVKRTYDVCDIGMQLHEVLNAGVDIKSQN